MSRKKAGGSRRRGQRTCRKQRPISGKSRRKPAYRHPLAAAMADLLKGLLPRGGRGSD